MSSKLRNKIASIRHSEGREAKSDYYGCRRKQSIRLQHPQ